MKTKSSKPTKSSEFTNDLNPYYDRQRHTILKISASPDAVKFIPLDINEGLRVMQLSKKVFDDTYKPIPNYPAKKACEMFFEYSKTLGATKEVMDILSIFTTVTEEDIKLATNKRKTESPLVPKSDGAKKPSKSEKPVKQTEKPTVVEKPSNPEKPSKVKQPEPVKQPASTKSKPLSSPKSGWKSAAEMFRGLIMEGKLTDEQIFEQVKEAFRVDDSKFFYVKAYRRDLQKAGMNPPEPVVKGKKK